jgi:tetratricopeptide (TPR) repeat protein
MNRLAMRIVLGTATAGALTLAAVTLRASMPGVSGQQSQQPAQGQQGQAPAQGQQSGQAAQPGHTAPGGQPVTPPSKQEIDDWNALRQEASTGLDTDKVVQLATDFEKKYPTSTMLTYVDMFAASAYQSKGDVPKSIEFGEKSLKLNPDNLMSLIIMADLLPTPQATKGSDKDKKLSEAETYANHALDLVAKMPKQPNETDDQAKKRRDALSADLHSSLGMVHLQRSAEGLTGPDKDELVKAEQEYKLATAVDKPSPQDFFRLGEAYSSDGKIDEAIEAFTKASQLGQGGPIQPYADQKLEELKKQKSTQAAPANPPAKP